MPSRQELERIQRRLFGDRFKAGIGLKDPAYMPLHAHEAAEYLFSGGRVQWDKHNSAGDLEAYVLAAPAIDELVGQEQGEKHYDDSARIAAKWILERLSAVPGDAKLVITFWEVMESVYPRMVSLQLSTAQKRWAHTAALRILDATAADRQITDKS